MKKKHIINKTVTFMCRRHIKLPLQQKRHLDCEIGCCWNCTILVISLSQAQYFIAIFLQIHHSIYSAVGVFTNKHCTNCISNLYLIRNENIHGFLRTRYTLLEVWQRMMNTPKYLKVFVCSVNFKKKYRFWKHMESKFQTVAV